MWIETDTKICKKCGLEKDIDEFNKSQGSICLSCVSKRSMAYYWANREEILKLRKKERQLRKKRISKHGIGFYYDKTVFPVYTNPNPINEVTLRIDEVRCIVCNCKLTYHEKLFGDYCITHSHGQTQNIYHQDQLYK